MRPNKYVQVLQQKAPEFNVRMVVPLAVAGAFHTDFMAGAVPKVGSNTLIDSPRDLLETS